MSASLGRPPVAPDIVEEYFDELDFLWHYRSLHLFAVDWTLGDLSQVEARAEAHRDGLRLAELGAIDRAIPNLQVEEMARASVATFVLLDCGDEALAGEVLRSLHTAPPRACRAIGRAMRHASISNWVPALADYVGTGPAAGAAAVADALAFQRVANIPTLREPDPDDSLASIDTLAALGRFKRFGRAEWEWSQRHADRAVRRAGVEAAVRSGFGQALDRCRENATGTSGPDPEAIRTLGCAGDGRDVELLVRATKNEAVAIDAVEALGASGRVAAVEPLLALLDDPLRGAHAACALRRLTGAPGALTIEAEAPPPDPASLESVRKFWKQHASKFTPHERWQLGRCVTPGLGSPVFADLTLGVRRDLWVGMSLVDRTSGNRFEVEDLAAKQLRAP